MRSETTKGTEASIITVSVLFEDRDAYDDAALAVRGLGFSAQDILERNVGSSGLQMTLHTKDAKLAERAKRVLFDHGGLNVASVRESESAMDPGDRAMGEMVANTPIYENTPKKPPYPSQEAKNKALPGRRGP